MHPSPISEVNRWDPAEALFPGTFNPIHCGHLWMAEAALALPGIERVCFIPSGTPPHRSADLAPAADRLTMVRLATQGHPRFTVWPGELARTGPAYTMDTVERLCPTGQRVFVILGADAAASLASWHRARDLLARIHGLVMPRPGVTVPDAFCIDGEDIPWSWTALDYPPWALSATWVRAQCRAGGSLRGAVPPAVARYLRENRIFQAE